MAKAGRIAGADSAGSARFKRILQTAHPWIGLPLAIPSFFSGISASALLLQREILAYSVPAASAQGEPAPLMQIIAAAQEAAPANATPRSIVPALYAGAPTTINFDTGGRPPRTLVHVDPVSLEV